MVKNKKVCAIKYRKKGYSYSFICRKLNLSKSTLSDWVKTIPFNPNQFTLLGMKIGSKKSAEVRHLKLSSQLSDIKLSCIREVGQLSKRDLWLFGLGMYLGEGAKSIESVRVINSDPKVIVIAIRWLIEVAGLGIDNLSLSLHSYPDNNIEDDIQYWSEMSGIPSYQFGKTQIDSRTGKVSGHRLPHGTVQLRVIARGNNKFGVFLHRQIMGWIDAVANQVEKFDII